MSVLSQIVLRLEDHDLEEKGMVGAAKDPRKGRPRHDNNAIVTYVSDMTRQGPLPVGMIM